MAKIPVWIDCDTGVDDAVALLVAHRLEALEIVGLSTVAGNVALDKTTRNTLAVCDLAGADYPVHPGAAKPWLQAYADASAFHGADGLGGASLPAPKRSAEKTPMWDALFDAAQRHPGTLTLVATGPLTNVATALAKYPQLTSLLARIVLMGGAAVGGNRTPCAEYNIFADPDAAQAVFRSGVPLVMCGLDVTHQAYLTPAELDALCEKGTAVTRFVRAATAGALHFNMSAGLGGLCLHDVCPLLYLAQPELFGGEMAGVFVETRGALTRGKTVTDLYSDHQFDTKNALVLLTLDRARFVEQVVRTLHAY